MPKGRTHEEANKAADYSSRIVGISYSHTDAAFKRSAFYDNARGIICGPFISALQGIGQGRRLNPIDIMCVNSLTSNENRILHPLRGGDQ